MPRRILQRKTGWSIKPDGWNSPLHADGICGYVSEAFTPCALPWGHDGPHTYVALNPESGPEAGKVTADLSGRPIGPLEETPPDSVARRQQRTTGEDPTPDKGMKASD